MSTMEMLGLSFVTIAGLILVAYIASRRRPSIKQGSLLSLRRKYARGKITEAAYQAELSRRRRREES